MDSLEDNSCWDFLDYNFIEETTTSSDFLWPNNQSGGLDVDFSSGGAVSQDKPCTRKRGRSDSCSKSRTKACREKLRREKLNDRILLICCWRVGLNFASFLLDIRMVYHACRFQDLSSVLEPGRPARIDKPAILDDAVRVLNQLKTEAQELKETNEKLQEEIKSLKAEKNELREEKLTLKADKERMEQQLKVIAVPPSGFMPAHPAAYHAGVNKMAVFPGYGLMPMWQLPLASRDISRDHEYWPPAA
ncbi:transcription factor bHLH104 isoform X1 [Manihot esculenta]|uniref:transcription factor bHLH104 isoform X1 n=1 Tax=Manihot esculenta TaxID=3983 RepID=UPI000B5D8530|nr:transcription factor bHLH104 isoform X1 [Manihot esculenta]